MTLTDDHIFAIILALFGGCMTLGGYVVRGALGRIKDLEARQCLTEGTHRLICDGSMGKLLAIMEGIDDKIDGHGKNIEKLFEKFDEANRSLGRLEGKK